MGMKAEIKERIEMINRGEVPEGYKKTKVGIIPQNWEEDRFGDLLKVASGEGLIQKEMEYGIYPVYGGNGISGWHNLYNFKESKIIIGRVGAYCGSVNLTKGKAWITDNALYVKEKLRDFCDLFMYYKLIYINLNRFAEKNAQPLISGAKIYEIRTKIPPIMEQRKIAEILSIWDKAIELKEKLIEQKKEQKKGSMQTLLTGKVRVNEAGKINRKQLKLRIEMIKRGQIPEGYKKTKVGIIPEEWEAKKAKEIFKNHTNKKHNAELEVLSATQDRGVIPRSQLDIDIKYDINSLTSYKKVEKGNFVISLRSFQGGIEYSEYEGLVSPAYTVLKNKISISDNYYRFLLKKEDFINRLNSVIYGIRDGKQIGYSGFGELYLQYPPNREQQTIAEILSHSAKEIELLEKELEALKEQKKGLMQLLLTGKVRVKY